MFVSLHFLQLLKESSRKQRTWVKVYSQATHLLPKFCSLHLNVVVSAASTSMSARPFQINETQTSAMCDNT